MEKARKNRALALALPDRAVSFFIEFSRFEFAMKRCGFLDHSEDGVRPSWSKLSARLGRDFLTKVIDAEIAPTLIATPPKKQVINNGALDWRPMPKVNGTQQLLEAVSRARNNLFHGGKYFEPALKDWILARGTSRSDTLLKESSAVMRLALEEVAELEAAFTSDGHFEYGWE